MADFYTILTAVGAAQIANAQALGQSVALSQIAVGDGGGAYTTPIETDTALVNEVWRGAINAINVHETEPGWLVIETVIPADVGGWYVREFGIFDDAGNLIAIGKMPETYKPLLAQGSGRDLYIRAIVAVGSPGTVELKIDPSMVLATRTYVESRDDLSRRVKMTIGGETAEVGYLYLFTAHGDLTLPAALDGQWVAVAVDHAVDLAAGQCRVLPPAGEQVSTAQGLADSCDIVTHDSEFRFIRVNGGWRV